MNELPPLALSVRQPWAWAIIHAGKDIENRSWATKFRGRVLIHASKGMTQEEYVNFGCRALRRELPVPSFDDLLRGGIVGEIEIVDCVTQSKSPWFSGPYGFVLRDPRPCEFIPARGALGFFRWSDAKGKTG
jgi:hypothetical protein